MILPVFFHDNHLDSLVSKPLTPEHETKTAWMPIIESLGLCMNVYKNRDNTVLCGPAKMFIKKDRNSDTLYFVIQTSSLSWEYKFGTVGDYIEFVEWETIEAIPIPGSNIRHDDSIEDYKEMRAKIVARDWGGRYGFPSQSD